MLNIAVCVGRVAEVRFRSFGFSARKTTKNRTQRRRRRRQHRLLENRSWDRRRRRCSLSISPGEHAIAILDPAGMTSLVRGTVALFTAAYASRIGADVRAFFTREIVLGNQLNNQASNSRYQTKRPQVCVLVHIILQKIKIYPPYNTKMRESLFLYMYISIYRHIFRYISNIIYSLIII